MRVIRDDGAGAGGYFGVAGVLDYREAGCEEGLPVGGGRRTDCEGEVGRLPFLAGLG